MIHECYQILKYKKKKNPERYQKEYSYSSVETILTMQWKKTDKKENKVHKTKIDN